MMRHGRTLSQPLCLAALFWAPIRSGVHTVGDNIFTMQECTTHEHWPWHTKRPIVITGGNAEHHSQATGREGCEQCLVLFRGHEAVFLGNQQGAREDGSRADNGGCLAHAPHRAPHLPEGPIDRER
jgi:hypothetical protein